MNISGTWLGKIQTPQGDIELTVSIKRAGNVWAGTIKGPRGEALDLKDLTVSDDGRFSFSYRSPQAPAPAKYDGTLNETGSFVKGQLSAEGMPAFDLNFARIDDGSGSLTDASGVKKYRPGSGPAGAWIGTIETHDDQDIEVGLHLDKDGANWVVVLHDPVMGDVRGENLRVSDSFIAFNFQPRDAAFPANFAGSYIAADDRITGTISQRGASRFVKFRREPGTVILTTIGPDGKPQEPAPTRHSNRFAATVRGTYWIALSVLKDDVYNLNNIQTHDFGYDLTLRWFPLDGFNVLVRGYRGGLGYDTTPEKLAPYEHLGLTKDSYMKLDGFEIGVMGYLGNVTMRNSKFNPYLTAAVGRVNWAVQTNGRGSPVVGDRAQPLQGSDFSFAGGIGTEYKLNEKWCIEFEWLWRYFATADEERFGDDDDYWQNTHAWNLSLGVTYGFW